MSHSKKARLSWILMLVLDSFQSLSALDGGLKREKTGETKWAHQNRSLGAIQANRLSDTSGNIDSCTLTAMAHAVLFPLLLPLAFASGIFAFGRADADFFAGGDEERDHDFQAGVETGGLPGGVRTTADGGSRVRHLQRYGRRQYDVHQASFEEQGAVFFVFFHEPAALADLLGAEGQFFKRFDIGENEILSVLITELDTAVLHVGEWHALAF